MTLNKTLVGAFSAAALIAVSASAAMAAPLANPILASSTGSTSPNVFYTSGGTFTGSDPGTLYVDRTTNVALFNTPFTLNAGTAGAFTTTATGAIQNFVSGGSFSYGTGGSVLSGTFATSTLTLTGTNTFAFVANDVVFTGGTHLDGFSTGALQLEAISAIPTAPATSFVNSTSTGFNSFTASDGVTISAVPSTVPEPATVVPFAMGGLALLGLIARKTRRTSSVSA